MSKKELAKTAEAGLPAYMQKDAGENWGNENVGQDDLIIPRLSLVQALSPEIKKKDPAYIEGAEQGMLFNTVSRKLYGESITIIPVMFEKPFLLWKDRKEGGGFGGSFNVVEEADAARAVLEDADKWEIVDTPTHLCLVIDGDDVSEVAIPMPKSKAKVSRQWNSFIRMLGGPRFSHAFKISGVEDENQNGEAYWNFKIDTEGFPPQDIYLRAKDLYKTLQSGNYTVQQDEAADAPAEQEAF